MARWNLARKAMATRWPVPGIVLAGGGVPTVLVVVVAVLVPAGLAGVVLGGTVVGSAGLVCAGPCAADVELARAPAVVRAPELWPAAVMSLVGAPDVGAPDVGAPDVGVNGACRAPGGLTTR